MWWTALLWIGWVIALGVSLGLTFLLFAFADAPELAKAIGRRANAVGVLVLVAVVGGATLLAWRGDWWQAPLAFALLPLAPLTVLGAYPRK